VKDRERLSLEAIGDFRHARRRAMVADLLGWLKGEPDNLLSFEEVRQKLKMQGSTERGLQDIPLDAIVGSVGRYSDFTRHFLPREQVSEQRWARVRSAMESLEGVPPIDVYQVGDSYFVQDGNHRVSVARKLGVTHMQAHVTEIRTRVHLTPSHSPDDLIIASEYADFLEQTRLDTLRPDEDLRVTVPGQYQLIVNHIEVQRYRMALRQERAVAADDATTSWYDTVYLPIVGIIRDHSLLRDFPGRTETDLYVWIAEHQANLEADLEWDIAPVEAADDLVSRQSRRPGRIIARLREQFLNLIRPETFKPGPPPGEWRRTHLADNRAAALFNAILVPLSGEPASWRALEQAIVIAQREGGVLHGLHVVPSAALRDSSAARAIRHEFEQRCGDAKVAGKLVIDAGVVVSRICERARWVDLVLVSLEHPPSPQPIARLRSGFRDLLQRCPQPVLELPGNVSPLSRALIAYDGSPKAHEALIIAAYLALRWGLGLIIVTALEQDSASQASQQRAWEYLDQLGIGASYVVERGPAAETILAAAADHRADLIITGGYGLRPELEIVLGSTVDHLLRTSQLPVLVCR